MGVQTPTSYHSISQVLRGVQLHWFLWDKQHLAIYKYRQARDLHQKWRDLNPWKFTTQSQYALGLVNEMIGAYTELLIYRHKPLEGNVVLESLYLLLNEHPPHLPDGTLVANAGLFFLLKTKRPDVIHVGPFRKLFLRLLQSLRRCRGSFSSGPDDG